MGYTVNQGAFIIHVLVACPDGVKKQANFVVFEGRPKERTLLTIPGICLAWFPQ